ncbi:hypothetical protein ACFQJ7_06685 [Halovenus rubra]|uniref:SpoIIAA-like n=2 Tax=Halovenus rubra TaxID=869890 RepID=A0ABD5X5B9_9EURY|nr:hypothetical protein [Halovenus rubra]
MGQASLPPSVTYEERGNVGVWNITSAASYLSDTEKREQGEIHFREQASRSEMNGTVVKFENAEKLGSEIRGSLDHINEEWSRLAEEVDIERLAYVADGMMATTVKMNIEADVSTESFDSIEDAVSWCESE